MCLHDHKKVGFTPINNSLIFDDSSEDEILTDQCDIFSNFNATLSEEAELGQFR